MKKPNPKAKVATPVAGSMRQTEPTPEAPPPAPVAAEPSSAEAVLAAIHRNATQTQKVLESYQAFNDVMLAKQPGAPEGALWVQLPGAPAFEVSITLPVDVRGRFSEREVQLIEAMLEDVTRNSMPVIVERVRDDLRGAVDAMLQQAGHPVAGNA
ncbi:hypothetical protein EOD42_14435 [Rhodovarius crocodyli]|uniref:Uncharacterized protein n=1 Tax=Rhodovarius crocodyli TaxID=1979269 RepID=A0A437MFA8_9PROT|nr:hypothetical protein [Rhodovarius crocodyli]RVT96305.1 hypothetical protein EOD42_14435 [Rhodovarius crocodyli]